MPKLIADLLNRPKIPFVYKPSNDYVMPECKVGIEIELEGVPNVRVRDRTEGRLWKIVGDGSLRNDGAEFVSEPVYGQDINNALADFTKTLNDTHSEPVVSSRTSVHVHMDVEDMSVEQLGLFLLLVTLFEKLLYTYCGYDRYDNIFCHPIEKSISTMSIISEIVTHKEDDPILDAVSGYHKYTGCNIKPILPDARKGDQGGHIEFRMHKGTYDTTRIKEWVNILMCLKKYSMEFEQKPEELLQHLSMRGLDETVQDIFGEYYNTVAYADMFEHMYDNMAVVQYIFKYSASLNSLIELYDKECVPNPIWIEWYKRKNNKRNKGTVNKEIQAIVGRDEDETDQHNVDAPQEETHLDYRLNHQPPPATGELRVPNGV